MTLSLEVRPAYVSRPVQSFIPTPTRSNLVAFHPLIILLAGQRASVDSELANETLSALAVVSRSWNQLVTPLLYERVHLVSAKSLRRFIQTCQKTSNGLHVIFISVDGPGAENFMTKGTKLFLRKNTLERLRTECPNLKHLSFRNSRIIGQPIPLFQNPISCPGITSLEILAGKDAHRLLDALAIPMTFPDLEELSVTQTVFASPPVVCSLPYLRRLALDGYGPTGEDGSTVTALLSGAAPSLERLRWTFKTFWTSGITMRLPELPRLRELDIEYTSNAWKRLVAILSTFAQSIRHLRLICTYSFPYAIALPSFPHIQSLTLGGRLRTRYSGISAIALNALRESPLEVLELRGYSGVPTHFLQVSLSARSQVLWEYRRLSTLSLLDPALDLRELQAVLPQLTTVVTLKILAIPSPHRFEVEKEKERDGLHPPIEPLPPLAIFPRDGHPVNADDAAEEAYPPHSLFHNLPPNIQTLHILPDPVPNNDMTIFLPLNAALSLFSTTPATASSKLHAAEDYIPLKEHPSLISLRVYLTQQAYNKRTASLSLGLLTGLCEGAHERAPRDAVAAKRRACLELFVLPLEDAS